LPKVSLLCALSLYCALRPVFGFCSILILKDQCALINRQSNLRMTGGKAHFAIGETLVGIAYHLNAEHHRLATP